MRIAMIIPTLAGGGLERVSLHLIREWVDRNIEVDLVVQSFQGRLCSEVPESVQVFEVARRQSLLFPVGLRRYINMRKPTHIVSAANDINAITLLIIGGRQDRVPTIITVHSHLSSELTQARGLRKVKELIVVWGLKRLVHRAKCVVAVSRSVADDFKRHVSLSERQLKVVYNPVVTTEVHERKSKPLVQSFVPRCAPMVVYVGRLVPIKGLDILLKAFEKVFCLTGAHLVLLGEGPLRSELQRLAADSECGGNIHIVGFQSNPLPWIREASVLVLPSRYEGLPTVLIEALACGTQVVATDCPGGSTEILCGGQYGQLVPVGDVDALSAALTRSLKGEFHISDAELVARSEMFTSERVARDYLIYLTG